MEAGCLNPFIVLLVAFPTTRRPTRRPTVALLASVIASRSSKTQVIRADKNYISIRWADLSPTSLQPRPHIGISAPRWQFRPYVDRNRTPPQERILSSNTSHLHLWGLLLFEALGDIGVMLQETGILTRGNLRCHVANPSMVCLEIS